MASELSAKWQVGELQNGQDSVDSVANRLKAQQQQLKDRQNAVSDARRQHYFLPLGALVPMVHSLFGDRSQVIPQIKRPLGRQKTNWKIYHALNVSPIRKGWISMAM